MKKVRFDRLDVATSDLADAATIYETNFGFTVNRNPDSDDAIIVLGDAQVRLRSGTAVADLISLFGEGLAGIWLEADDVDDVARLLQRSGIATAFVRIEQGRRVLAVEPKAANMVPLFIFDRQVDKPTAG